MKEWQIGLKEERTMWMEVNDVSQLLDALKTHKVVIYGTGYVATRFYNSLKEYGVDGNVECFITTEGSKDTIDGKGILSIDKFENAANIIICIAVHESIKDEIVEILEGRGISNFLWIYPFQYALMLGKPISKGIKVPIKLIMNQCYNDYRMAVRYLAIENYYNKNDVGYEIYVKTMALHCSKKTALNRLQQFIFLIKNWEINGYDKIKPVIILENNELLDGTHRVAVASYFGQSYIVCDVFSLRKSIWEMHNEASRITGKSLRDAGINSDIIDLLEHTNQRIIEQYV